MVLSLRERIMLKISVCPIAGCWLWTGCLSDGYSRIRVSRDGKYVGTTVHRVLYEMDKGKINPGLELDHLCRVRKCCNPDHLEPVKHQVNSRRGNVGLHQSKKTHCPQGHAYDQKNTLVFKGERHCRACKQIYDRKRKLAKKAVKLSA